MGLISPSYRFDSCLRNSFFLNKNIGVLKFLGQVSLNDNISIGSLLSLDNLGNGDKSGAEVTVLETFFGKFEQANNYRITSTCPGATAEGAGIIQLVKDNKFEVATSIGKVVEFW